MDLGLKGKVALVMGGGNGIGRAPAQRLVTDGCDVLRAPAWGATASPWTSRTSWLSSPFPSPSKSMASTVFVDGGATKTIL
jgi:hypothetical protein